MLTAMSKLERVQEVMLKWRKLFPKTEGDSILDDLDEAMADSAEERVELIYSRLTLAGNNSEKAKGVIRMALKQDDRRS